MDAHLYQSNRQNRRRERERNASGDPSAHNSRVRATLSVQLSLTGGARETGFSRGFGGSSCPDVSRDPDLADKIRGSIAVEDELG